MKTGIEKVNNLTEFIEGMKDREHLIFNDEPQKIESEHFPSEKNIHVIVTVPKEAYCCDAYVHFFVKLQNGEWKPYCWYSGHKGIDPDRYKFLPDCDGLFDQVFKEILGYEHPEADEGWSEGRAELGMQGISYIVCEATDKLEEFLKSKIDIKIK